MITLLIAPAASHAAPPGGPGGAAMRRYAPSDGHITLGLYGGVMRPSDNHSFYGTQWRPLRAAVGSVGVRFGYFPLRWVGLEVEAGGLPGRLKDGSYFNAFALRGHALLQLPLRVAPFALAGAGVLMVRTPDRVLGTDADPAWHMGAGVKFHALEWLALRLEWRGTFSNDRGANAGPPAMHNEVVLGLSFAFGPKTGSRPPPTEDPRVSADASAPSCGDGVRRPDDRRTHDPASAIDGCAPADSDRDGDGITDALDRCPEEAGTLADGCAPRDSDGDGVMDPEDRCAQAAETRNGFDDADGCPDALPTEIPELLEASRRISFDAGKASLSPASHLVLDASVLVLRKYPSLRLEIVGHTDDVGSDEKNLELSRARAEVVRSYLLAHGIEAGRVTADGVGGARPVASNRTAAGRAQNRRIEFVVVLD